MKKKLLSLVLAGAMVASTSVSAFAATSSNAEYDISAGDVDHRVNIEGNITNRSNEVVPGTINVTVPTSVSFTIDKDGKITGGDIRIQNSSNEKVKVVAEEFTDTNSKGGIVIVKEADLDDKIQNENSDTKRHISLNLVGDKTLGLISEKTDGKTGFIDQNGEEIENTQNTSLGNAWQGNDLVLHLSGRTTKTGTTYAPPTNPIQNSFNLVLKIQKVQ